MSSPSPFAIITGASRGIGAAYASALAKQGYDLLLVARDIPRLEQIAADLQKQHGVTIETNAMNLTTSEAAQTLHAHVQSLNRPISLIVQNAGFGFYGDFAEMPQEKVQAMTHLHVQHITESTRLFLPDLIAQGRGAMIIVSSVVGFIPIPYMAEYAATKAYLKAFGEAIAYEIRGTGVTIQVCCPGFTETDFHDTAGSRPRHIFFPQSAHQVAEVSLKALESSRTIVTIGWQGRLTKWVTRLIPQKILLSLAAGFVKPPSPSSLFPH